MTTTWWRLGSIAKQFNVSEQDIISKLVDNKLSTTTGEPIAEGRQKYAMRTKKGEWRWHFKRMANLLASSNPKICDWMKNERRLRQVQTSLSIIISVGACRFETTPPKKRKEFMEALTKLIAEVDNDESMSILNEVSDSQCDYLMNNIGEWWEHRKTEKALAAKLTSKLEKKGILLEDFEVLDVCIIMSDIIFIEFGLIDKEYSFNIGSADQLDNLVNEIYSEWKSLPKQHNTAQIMRPKSIRKIGLDPSIILWTKEMSIDAFCKELEQYIKLFGFMTLEGSEDTPIKIARVDREIKYNGDRMNRLLLKQCFKNNSLDGLGMMLQSTHMLSKKEDIQIRGYLIQYKSNRNLDVIRLSPKGVKQQLPSLKDKNISFMGD